MILQDMNQINQVLTDMVDAFHLLPIDAREFLYQKLTEDMAQLNNTSIYTFHIFKQFYDRAQRYGVSIPDASILELGAGKPLGTGILWNLVGARKYTAIDRYNQMNINDLWLSRFKDIPGMNIFNPCSFNLDTVIKSTGEGTFIIDQERISLIQGIFEHHHFAPGSFDLIYSNGALEHFADMELQAKKMHEVLSPNGTMIHGIDLRQHNTDKVNGIDVNTSVEFLRYSPDEWAGLYPAGSYHYVNRLRSRDFQEIFRNAGFTIVENLATLTMDLDESVYSRIHPCFHSCSLEDLSTTGMLIVLRKGA